MRCEVDLLQDCCDEVIPVQECRMSCDEVGVEQDYNGMGDMISKVWWYVDDIIAQKRIDGKAFYKVKWIGPYKSSWQPEENLVYVKKTDWEVEKLVGHKVEDGQVYYLVKWVDWEDTNWESYDVVNDCTAALRKYWKKPCKLDK
ncbi:chromo (CHRromatin organization MOdifier) domain-containing protein [Ditylenchus destructor]|nr:chromo (CHRromatin organization MOdifier) domain-containing protein [Ditylenchus destructor]